MVRLDEVARTLYALPPAEFVPGRNAAAKDEPDPEAARTIRAFRKPSAAAGAVNAFVRAEPDAVDELLAVGAGLRAAQEGLDRDAVRDFSRRRQQVLASAEKKLATVVEGLSPSTLREVEETLQAAMIDRAAAAALQSGFLVRGLESSGLEPVDLAAAVALPIDVEQFEARMQAPASGPPAKRAKAGEPASASASDTEPRESAAERKARERRHTAAVQRAERTLAELTEVTESMSEVGENLAALEAERDRLSRELASAESALAAAREAERELRRRRKSLEREARDARRALESES
ncbi:hypothetical protein [Diaminobutyricibacter sp. McL0608]|uniref:hypothetical protein n=1 Tax=Leifsonia sp. McL0608 TaxID=3143537 RepID=UPI0031F3260F